MRVFARKPGKVQQNRKNPEEIRGKPEKNRDFLLTNALESRKVNGGWGFLEPA
jgi:hypothetical protein